MKRQIVFAVLKATLVLTGAACFVATSAAFFDGLIGPGWAFRPIYFFLGVVATAATAVGYLITDYVHAFQKRPRKPIQRAPLHRTSERLYVVGRKPAGVPWEQHQARRAPRPGKSTARH